MAEPRTEAGKRLAAYVSPASDVHEGWYPWRVVRDAILAIEAEARSLAPESEGLDLDAIRQEVVEAAEEAAAQYGDEGYPPEAIADAVYEILRVRVRRAALNPESPE